MGGHWPRRRTGGVAECRRPGHRRPGNRPPRPRRRWGRPRPSRVCGRRLRGRARLRGRPLFGLRRGGPGGRGRRPPPPRVAPGTGGRGGVCGLAHRRRRVRPPPRRPAARAHSARPVADRRGRRGAVLVLAGRVHSGRPAGSSRPGHFARVWVDGNGGGAGGRELPGRSGGRGRRAAVAVLRPPPGGGPAPAPPPRAPLPALGAVALVTGGLYAAAALTAAGRAVTAVPDASASVASLLSSEGGGGDDGGAAALPSWRALAADFVSGSLAMLARSLTLQVTFFVGVAVAARFGTAALAAHGVVHQLWMLSAYALDGFETSATVLGVRVATLGEEEEGAPVPPADGGGGEGGGGGGRGDRPAASAARAAYARLARRCVGGAAVGGAVLAAAIAAAGPAIVSAFLRPGARARALLSGAPLAVLAAAQPLNGAAYAVDGLLASMHAWRPGAGVIFGGFACVYLPAVAAVAHAAPGGPGIAGIWAAKIGLNAVRVVGGLAVVWRAWAARVGADQRRGW